MKDSVHITEVTSLHPEWSERTMLTRIWTMGEWARMNVYVVGTMCKEVRKCGACEEVKHHSVRLDHGNQGDRDSGL